MTDGDLPLDVVARLRAALLPLPASWHTPPDRRDAAVLVPVIPHASGARLLYTRRPNDLPQHPGQVSFPGGRRDTGEDPEACALREFEEELGVPRARVEVMGALPCRDSSTGFCVHPIVGVVHDASGLRPDPREVECVFEVPLAQLCQSERWEEREVQRGALRRKSPHFAVADTWIWGLTARITLDLIGRLP